MAENICYEPFPNLAEIIYDKPDLWVFPTSEITMTKFFIFSLFLAGKFIEFNYSDIKRKVFGQHPSQ
jgi:hypothetical protein